MKHLTVLILILAATIPAFAQQQTLLDTDDIEHGGYGAFVLKFTTLNNEFAVLAGARGGWIINHTVAIGFAGYGVANNIHSFMLGPLGERFLMLGYGGLDLEFILNSDDLVHLSFHSLIGGGSVGFRNGMEDDWMANDGGGHHDGFFVVEPGVNLDLNVMTWFRASVGASYRYVSGITSGASKNDDIRGPSAMLTLRFGEF